MRTHVSKWGHSLAVRIPRAFAEQLGVEEGSAIEIVAEADAITLRKPEYRLEALVGAMTADNLHGETDTGSPVGKEEW